MRKSFYLVLVLGLLLWIVPYANAGNFGLGVVVGDPTGISGKLWTSKTTALDGAAAWSLGRHARFQFQLDYVYHNFSAIKVQEGRFPIYYGFGARIKSEEHETGLGVRVPVGLDYIFAKAPVDIFLEIAPAVTLVPDTTADFDIGLGVRFFFP